MLHYQSLKKIKKEKKVTSTELAKCLDKTRETVSSWERGIHQPCVADIRIMAQILNGTSRVSFGSSYNLIGYDKRSMSILYGGRIRKKRSMIVC